MNNKVNVLYVDDEENNLISFRATFRKDFNVLTANSAETGINILHKEFSPVIITDQRMPEMTGVEFLEKIIPEFPDTVRMILTGFSDIEAIIQAINTGRVFRYITKPWDEKELKITIDNAIGLYNLQLRNKQLITDLDQKVKEQERTLNLFKKYVPPSIVEKTLMAKDELSLFAGELIDVSVLFCDIRNFTSISESLNPKDVVTFLNYFYSAMTECIKRHFGTVNQYIGDEIFATFGAPISYPDNHINAVFAAMEMIQKLDEVNERYASKLNHRIEVGIGINSGQVVAGNLGTEEKIEYSITGDTVNTCKRIETLTKEFANTILISHSTFERTNGLFKVKAWNPVLVKGKKEAVMVYEIIGA